MTVAHAGSGRGTSRSLLRTWLTIAGVGIPFLGAGLLLAGVIGAELGMQVAALALVVAAVPLGVVVPSFLWLDRLENEPRTYLWFAFLWGALIATTLSLLVNTGSLILLESAQFASHTVAAVAVAPVVEESLKGAGVLLILLFRRREFDGIVDGLVYAGLCAAGFAFAENVLYLGRALQEAGSEGLVAVFVLRCVLGPFAHPLFTCCTGVGIGFAATKANGSARVFAPLAGLALAIALHASWNYSAVVGLDGYFTRYLAFQLPVFVAAVAFAAWARRRESWLIAHHLSAYVPAGWLSPAEVAMLAGLPNRRQARVWARRTGGRLSHAAMRAFQDHASELALLRMRMMHGTAPQTAAMEERLLLERMNQARTVYLRPVPAGPFRPPG